MIPVRETLRRRLTREALILLLVFQGIVFGVGGTLVVWPLLGVATDDLASVMVASAEQWLNANPDARTHSADSEHALWLQTHPPAELRRSYFPFAQVLSRALAARPGQADAASVRVDRAGRYWAPVVVSGTTVWVGFDAERVGTRPPLAFLLSAAALIVLAVGFSVMVAARMTRPLTQLVAASERLGHGDTEVRVPESGPREVAALAQAFNALAGRLRELLDNRATLLVGLSHDLRTPLARLRLSLEMIDGAGNAELIAGMERDLDALKALLDDVLTLERGLHLERGQQARVDEVIANVVATARRTGLHIDCADTPCALGVSGLALRRVLENLLENAVRYGGPAPITLSVSCNETDATVEVADRGPGIQEAQRAAVLRPFYRLESSRNSDTGGSGLGLAIVQQICRAQGWGLALQEREGGGLRVTLKINRD